MTDRTQRIKERVLEILKEKAKMPDANKDGIPDFAQDGKGKNDLGKGKTKPKKKAKKGEIPPQLRKHVKGKQNKEEDLDEITNQNEIPAAPEEDLRDAQARAKKDRKSQRKKEGKPVEEGGAAQRHDNPDRLRRQDPDRIREEEELEEETIDEGKCPHCDGNAPKSECIHKNESKSELTTIKKNQSSITRLNENRLFNLNKRLMQRLIK